MIQVIDTNIIINEPNLESYKGMEILVPLNVFTELDRLKSKDDVGKNIRKFFNMIKKRTFLPNGGYVANGITFIKPEEEKIYNTADEYFLYSKLLFDGTSILNTSDFSLYETIRLLGGNSKYIGTKDKWDCYTGVSYTLPSRELFPNEYLVTNYKGSIKKQRYDLKQDKLVSLYFDQRIFGISPKNVEQELFLDALSNDKITVVSCVGGAGTGKTILALAYALESVKNGDYNNILLGKSTVPLNKYSYMGFTPGDLLDKLIKWFSNYTTNIAQLFNTEKSKRKKYNFDKEGKFQEKVHKSSLETLLESVMDNYNLELLDISSIMGASFDKTIVIIDECQLFNKNDMRAILSRVKDNCKLILIGDLDQGAMINEQGGLRFLIDVHKDDEEFAHVELQKTERGKVADKINKKWSGI